MSSPDNTPLRVVQWATGSVGSRSLRALVEDERFQVVGGFTYSGAKAGTDLGTAAGLEPIGVVVTADIEDVLALDADCVVYNALGDALDPAACLDDICRLLASGKNVVSTAVSTHIHPAALTPETADRIEKACANGGTTLHSTGVNPGFGFDVLPVSLAGIAGSVDRIRALELVDMSGYDSAVTVRDLIGMGMPPDELALMDYMDDVRISPYLPCFSLLGDAMGFVVDDFTIERHKAVTEVDVQLPWGTVAAGTVAAKRIVMNGFVDGVSRVVYEMVWRVSDVVAPEWPSGGAHYEVVIEGDPTLTCRLDITSDTGRGTSAATALHAVNAIPAVCAAQPGLLTRLDAPLFGGGHLTRTTDRSATSS